MKDSILNAIVMLVWTVIMGVVFVVYEEVVSTELLLASVLSMYFLGITNLFNNFDKKMMKDDLLALNHAKDMKIKRLRSELENYDEHREKIIEEAKKFKSVHQPDYSKMTNEEIERMTEGLKTVFNVLFDEDDLEER